MNGFLFDHRRHFVIIGAVNTCQHVPDAPKRRRILLGSDTDHFRLLTMYALQVYVLIAVISDLVFLLTFRLFCLIRFILLTRDLPLLRSGINSINSD